MKKLLALVKCQFTFSRFGFFSAANGVVTFVSDVLQPFTQAVTFLLVGSVVCLISSVAWSHLLLRSYSEIELKDPLPSSRLQWAGDVVLFFAVATTFLVAAFGAQRVTASSSDSSGSANGFSATLIPAVRNIQESLRVIGADLARINAKLDNVKAETSTDPRKELANLGLAWNADNFLTAVKDGDDKLVKLFLGGGMHYETAESQGRPLPIMLALNTVNSPGMLDLLVKGGLTVDQTFRLGGLGGERQITLLGSAIERGNVELVDALMKHHANSSRGTSTFGALGLAKQTYPLASAVYWKQFAIANMLLDAGADPSSGNYAAYAEAADVLRRPLEVQQRTELEKLRDRLAPAGAVRVTADARQRLVDVERELNAVALESLRSMPRSAEHSKFDRRYNELQVERRSLQKQLGTAGDTSR